eukprot:1058627-Prorocentrum_minimum.AAC.3
MDGRICGVEALLWSLMRGACGDYWHCRLCRWVSLSGWAGTARTASGWSRAACSTRTARWVRPWACGCGARAPAGARRWWGIASPSFGRRTAATTRATSRRSCPPPASTRWAPE